MNTKIKQNTKAIILGLVIAIGAGYVSAWTGPSLPPTQGNVAAPINVGGGTAGNIYTQTKSGILNLAHLITSDFTVTNADATVTNIPNGSVLVADGDNTGKVKWAATSTLGLGSGGGTGVINGKADWVGSGVASTPDQTMTLSGTGPYNVVISAAYSTCYDTETTLYIDGSAVSTYGGYGTDTQGCDQNTIFANVTLAAGSHNLHVQKDKGIYEVHFAWSAYGNIIGAVSSVTASAAVQPGTVGGGCYGTYEYVGMNNVFGEEAWGNATTGGGLKNCHCPSGYTYRNTDYEAKSGICVAN